MLTAAGFDDMQILDSPRPQNCIYVRQGRRQRRRPCPVLEHRRLTPGSAVLSGPAGSWLSVMVRGR